MSLSMDNEYLKKQLLDEIKEAHRVKELNVQLMEQLTYTSHWVLNYCNNHKITPPNTDRLLDLIQACKRIVKDIYEPYRRSDEILHGEKDNENRRRLDSTIGAKT